jgi:hypothetical protein
VVGEEANKLLLEMNFKQIFPWNYDPSGVIAETRLRDKNSPYAHVPKPEIEKFMNQIEWEEKTLTDTDQHPPSASISPTNTPQVPAEKRPRKEVSPSVTKVSTNDFQVYIKRPKTSHTPDRSGGEETQSTTVMEGENSPFSSGSQQMMSTSSSKKQDDTTLITRATQEPAGLNLFEKYNLIKKKNEILKNSTYSQFWKQTSIAQHRLLSNFDTDKGRIHMAYLQAQVP